MALVAGRDHNCTILNDNSVKCWGTNNSGVLGLGDEQSRGSSPSHMGDNLPTVDLGSGKTAIRVSANFLHTCALLNDGSVKCWGDNSLGRLGLGDTAIRGDGPNEMGDNLPVVDLGAGQLAMELSAGFSHTCAILQDGRLKCWGYNDIGQLGLFDPENPQAGDEPNEMGDDLPVVDLGAGALVSGIAADQSFTCALLEESRIKCWGGNQYGELGLGDTDHRGDEPGEMGDNLPVVTP
jgi:alpha-tubulin suppressor-like RCC1 family protein